MPRVATIRKPRSCSSRRDPGRRRLVAVGDGDEHGAGGRQLRAGGGLRLRERGREVARDPHHLAGRAHLGPEQRVGAGEAVERQHRLLDAHVAVASGPRAGRGRRSARRASTRQASFASGSPIAFETNGTVRDARGLASITYSPSSPWIANWTLSSPTTPSARAIPPVCSRICVEHLVAERVRRQHAGRVAGVDAGLLDVLHDPADPDVVAVAERVDVDLDRVLEEAVEEDRRVRARRRRARGSRCSPSTL